MTNESALLSQDFRKSHNFEVNHNQSVANFLYILERCPPTGVANYWEERLLFINDYGEACIRSQMCRFSAGPASETEWGERIRTFKIATACDRERVIDQGRLQADLDPGGPLEPLVARVHQGLIIDKDTKRIGGLNKDGKAAAEGLTQALTGYLRDDITICSTKDWLFDNVLDSNQVLKSFQITAMSSDAEVSAAAAEIRRQAENQRAFLRDDVEIELRDIVFDALAERNDNR